MLLGFVYIKYKKKKNKPQEKPAEAVEVRVMVSPAWGMGLVNEQNGSRGFWGDVPIRDLGVGCTAEFCLYKSIELYRYGRCSLVL